MFLASKILNEPYEELMELKHTNPQKFKHIRNQMKACNFGLIYGMTAETLFERLLLIDPKVTPERATQIYKIWHSTFPEIQDYYDHCEIVISQYRKPIFGFDYKNQITSVRGRVHFNQLINYPVQSTCADILKLALRAFKLSQQKGFISQNIKVVLTAHDEIVFECDDTADIEKTRSQVVLIMEVAGNLILQELVSGVSVEVESSIGKCWADKT